MASQVVLSLQLPFAISPLVRLAGDRRVTGEFANGPVLTARSWALFAVVVGAHLWWLASALR